METSFAADSSRVVAPRSADILSASQIASLRGALAGKLLAVCFGSGVDSTAMLVALHAAGLRPDLIAFADTGGEKPETYRHIDAMNVVLRRWGWPEVVVVRKAPLASTGYTDLYGNCLANQTLPSLAFGMKSCSIKWKQVPQDQYLKGVKSGQNRCDPHPLWLQAKGTGQRITKLIGYDCGPADKRRSGRLPIDDADAEFEYVYPLQLIGWGRPECVGAIAAALTPALVPVKSSCFFCPASKAWELFWLAAHHPDLLEAALHLERVALTGKHSRFDTVEFGASWEEMVRGAERFPSSKTTIGLGRSFAWNHWARVNGVVDDEFRVHRDPIHVAQFEMRAAPGRDGGNALDARQASSTSTAAPHDEPEPALAPSQLAWSM